MKKIISTCIALMVSAACSISAFAMEVPTNTTIQDLNGVRQYIKIYTVTPDTDPQSLIDDVFEYDGYTYTYSSMTKEEQSYSEKEHHTETVTADTEKSDLSVVLKALSPSIEYDDGEFRGTLYLDHSTISTVASGYQRCANRKQIETICVNYLRSLEATKLSVNGHMYFVPRTHMDQVDIFEDFITLLSGLNKRTTPLIVNSFYIIDDAKQREKMTEEFYNAVKKEIAVYQEKCDYLIKSNSQSPAIMERWVLKVQALEEKKRHYEGVLQRELSGLDDEFSVLKLLSQELQVRSNSIRNQRFRQRAA